MEQSQSSTFPLFASVILDLAIDKTLDYGIPESMLSSVQRGMQVKVRVRGALRKGYVHSIKSTSPFPKVQPIEELISSQVLIPDDLFELAVWMGHYYCAPLSVIFKIILPSPVRDNLAHKEQYYVLRAKSKETLREICTQLREAHPSQALILEEMLQSKKGILLTELLEKTGVSKSPVDSLAKKGLLLLETVRIDRSPLTGQDYFRTFPKTLNENQAQAFQNISQAIRSNLFETHLLFGVTGSGKTEIYLQLIDLILKLEKSAILLVPEISLTAQTIERFRSRFEEHIAILHHRLSHGERLDEWHRIHRGEARIVIGARSALFSPVVNLGLIIVDEEHDGAYKQSEESPCYHARDVAVMRGKLSKSVVVLGSATPSLESYANAKQGKYKLQILSQRVEDARLPHVKIVDMKREFDKAKGLTSFSEILIEGIKTRMSRGEQSILFLNRRGYHTTLLCPACGHVTKCPHCDLALTFHLDDNILACHLCDYRLSPPSSCTECKSTQNLKFRGVGTEHVERALHAIFPEIRTLRMDGDTTRHKGSHERLFREFRTGKSDVLIGTQMIAKGLHFPSVTLVAVLNSDSGLHIPDFRASEHVFQLLTQVAGRAGRGALPGEVIIQTQMPDHPVIHYASRQDYEEFFNFEIESRKLFGFPPHSHLVKFTFSGLDPKQVQEWGNQLRSRLVSRLNSHFSIHPLLPSGHPKIKDHYRFQFLVCGPSSIPVSEESVKISQDFSLPSTIRMSIDVDPLSTFF